LQAGNYKPTLYVKDILGCYDTIINPLVQLNIYGPTAAFTNLQGACINSQIKFTDQSFSDGTHKISGWVWDYGDGMRDTLFQPPFLHTYNSSGSFDVKVVVYDNNGCYDTLIKKQAVIIDNPLAAFGVQSAISCRSSQVNFY